MNVFFDYDGEPMTREEWLIAFESEERLLKQEWLHVRDGRRYWISTVWIGIDHNFSRSNDAMVAYLDEEGVLQAVDKRPWIYETMVFENRPAWNSVFAQIGDEVAQVRHATREEAFAMHELLKAAQEIAQRA